MEKIKLAAICGLFLTVVSCSSNSTEENTDTTFDSGGVVMAVPPQNPTQNTSTNDTARNLKAPGSDYIIDQAKRNEAPATSDGRKVTRDTPWKRMLREYHVLLCKITQGTASPRDKERFNKINAEVSSYNQKLSGAERLEFMAEHAKAADMKNCR